jgi:hypothetical protein
MDSFISNKLLIISIMFKIKLYNLIQSLDKAEQQKLIEIAKKSALKNKL